MPNQNWVWGVYIYHKYWDNTRFRQKKLHVYDFQVRLWVAAFLAFLVLKFWKCGKMWPSISKWTYTCQKNLKIQVRKYLAFDLAFLTFVGLFKILLRLLRCKKSGGMQESWTLAFYHQKQFSLKISHFESVCKCILEVHTCLQCLLRNFTHFWAGFWACFWWRKSVIKKRGSWSSKLSKAVDKPRGLFGLHKKYSSNPHKK